MCGSLLFKLEIHSKYILNILKIIRNFKEKIEQNWKKSIIFLSRQKFKNPFPTLFSITTKLTKKYILECGSADLKKKIDFENYFW
jgi:hypothetical protein